MMRLWHFLIAVGVVLADGGGEKHQPINLAVLLPIADDRRPFSEVRLRPAIDMAVDQVSTFLPRRLRLSYRDSNCSVAQGMNEAIKYFMDGPPNVYFGPICDYAVAPVARQSHFWDIPVVTVGALDRDFLSNRRVSYPLLTRAGPVNLFELTDTILEVMHEYRWRRMKLLYEHYAGSDVIPPFCHLAAGTVWYLLDSASSQRLVRKHYHKFDLDPAKINFDEVLINEVGLNYAVVVLCASAHTVRKIMLKAAELHFDNGEYVFINIDLFSTKSQLAKPWYSANDTDENNEVARRAYESLMTITLRKPDSPEYLNFSRQVKKRARKEFGTDVFDDDEGVNSFVGAFHDAVILYALALNETLEAGIDATNGTEITRRMWNRTFEGFCLSNATV